MSEYLPLTFAVIGAAKSGTTALCQYLAQHPGVFIADPKEPHYLALGKRRPQFTGPGDDVTINAKSVWRKSDYLALFSSVGETRVVGEGSVSSLYYPKQTIATLKAEARPDVRLICILRNPVDRAWSAYNYLRARSFETNDDFQDALERESERIAAGYHHMWHYRRMGLYDQQLQPFYDSFDRRQLLILRHEELRKNPLATLRTVCDFLGVGDFEPDWTPNPHRSGKPRSKAVARALNVDSHWKSSLKAVLPTPVRATVREVLSASTVRRVALDAAIREELADFYRPHVARLEELTRMEFVQWRSAPAPVLESPNASD